MVYPNQDPSPRNEENDTPGDIVPEKKTQIEQVETIDGEIVEETNKIGQSLSQLAEWGKDQIFDVTERISESSFEVTETAKGAGTGFIVGTATTTIAIEQAYNSFLIEKPPISALEGGLLSGLVLAIVGGAISVNRWRSRLSIEKTEAEEKKSNLKMANETDRRKVILKQLEDIKREIKETTSSQELPDDTKKKQLERLYISYNKILDIYDAQYDAQNQD